MRDEATYLSQSSVARNSYGSAESSEEQYDWQTYYNYAQYFYERGDQKQAEAYYAHAQHLYNAEQQRAQQSSGGAQTGYQSDAGGQDDYVSFIERQHPSADAADQQQTVTWQSLYQYAQQLYEAGYQAQAEAYYSQAQQLYNDAVAQASASDNSYTTQPAQTDYATKGATIPPSQSAYATKGATIPPSQTEYATKGATIPPAVPRPTISSASSPEQSAYGDNTVRTAPPTPSSSDSRQSAVQSGYATNNESYVSQATAGAGTQQNYAAGAATQQGYAAGTAPRQGYTAGAATQQGYAAGTYTAGTATQQGYAVGSAGAQQSTRARTTARSTIPPSQATSWSTDIVSQASAESFPSSDVADAPDYPVPHRKHRLKFWSIIVLVASLTLFIGGFFILLHAYKQQLNRPDFSHASGSFLDTIHNATIQPMINLMQPAFDKTIRLSTAAEPLLYELNLTDTVPTRYREIRTDAAPVETKSDIIEKSVTSPDQADSTAAPNTTSTDSGENDDGALNASASADTDTPSTDTTVRSTDNAAAASDSSPEAEADEASKQASAAPDDAPAETETVKKASKKVRRRARARARRNRAKARRKSAGKRAARQVRQQQAKRSPRKKSKRNTSLGNDPLGAFNL